MSREHRLDTSLLLLSITTGIRCVVCSAWTMSMSIPNHTDITNLHNLFYRRKTTFSPAMVSTVAAQMSVQRRSPFYRFIIGVLQSTQAVCRCPCVSNLNVSSAPVNVNPLVISYFNIHYFYYFKSIQEIAVTEFVLEALTISKPHTKHKSIPDCDFEGDNIEMSATNFSPSTTSITVEELKSLPTKCTISKNLIHSI